jgi:hypothetical protein
VNARTIGLAALALAGCGDGYEDYYPDRVDPEVESLDPAVEAGNAGGEIVTIRGSGFGEDPNGLIVLIDNHNAEILTVADSEVVVRTPAGPITGGPVDLVVATDRGYTLLPAEEAPYTYGSADFSGVQDGFYSGQRAYINVVDTFDSCFGGLGAGIAGCEGTNFTGQVGIGGDAEFLRFGYPRLHTTNIGWLTAFDASAGDWRVRTPDPVFPSGIDDLRNRLSGPFTIRNPDFEDTEVCVDPNEELVSALSDPPCTGEQIPYNLGRLQFCEGQQPGEGGTREYRTDWPVNHDFFSSLQPDEPVEVRIDLTDLGLADLPVRLPPKVDVLGTRGFAESDQLPWDVAGMSACFDGNNSGQSFLNESGVRLEWTPFDAEQLESQVDGDRIQAINSYMHVSMTSVDIGWFGLETVGVRASIVVPQDHEFRLDDDGIPTASLSIPNEILYQMPTPNSNWSGTSQSGSPLDQTGFLGTYADNPRYLFFEVYRITDYRIQTDDGPIVFSYSTGDITLLDFENPMTQEFDCFDCLDGDGDGWTDDLDPDCNEDFGGNGETEVNATTVYLCNDGIDNNRDGRTDADDPLCEAGWDGETTCGNRTDDDGDGWIDELDPDCSQAPDPAFAQEDGSQDGSFTCNDGIDNDGDGWIDAGDPACADGTDSEDDGQLGTACNDGIDQDLHGDPDHLDVTCVIYGADYDSEVPEDPFGACINRRDDDNDGFVDLNDPDCEYRPHNRERDPFHEVSADRPVVNTCYDGLDNDGDGLVDAEDPTCWNPALGFAPDGFLDEGGSRGTGCTDGLDEDGDGWIDGQDPDCQPGDPATQDETGFGDTQCNDGIDNDGDGLIDAEDVDYCRRGRQDFEGPS